MSSLKGYIPGLARLLGTSPAALYERQRALVRAGLLDVGEGRGPGTGVRATDRAIALLLISVLATDRLSDAEDRSRAIAGAKLPARIECPFTSPGMRSFRDALATILFGPGKADLVKRITVSRTADHAEIEYYDSAWALRTVNFVGVSPDEPPIGATATITTAILQQIASDAQAIIFNEIEGGKAS